ncbi:hypothetical protein [Candidatus Nardonella dryophthoridicola]|uniref:OsmY protein n=1 Tax=endosymbiont of Rhynchophorus ferrugineus TaxID=1972133 RepID=A0A2Z5TP98_9GAMM|nr:hypothetical protein [Candidatus Nardonella dryophthoridicola]QTJ62806.1 hypothetical protein JRY34_00690 [Candidatus Nardonella dryophthoridicola]BBA85049.1 osmY protein [endosymbiont of Rhynchophorus ferrugineus]
MIKKIIFIILLFFIKIYNDKKKIININKNNLIYNYINKKINLKKHRLIIYKNNNFIILIGQINNIIYIHNITILLNKKFFNKKIKIINNIRCRNNIKIYRIIIDNINLLKIKIKLILNKKIDIKNIYIVIENNELFIISNKFNYKKILSIINKTKFNDINYYLFEN